MKRVNLAVLLLILTVCAFSGIVTEEQARDFFSDALQSWYEGDVSHAREMMERALSGLVYVGDIPEFWYLTAKIEIETGLVEKAREDLKTILVVSPGRSEVVSLLKEIDWLTNETRIPTPTFSNTVFKYNGFVNGIEWFYSPVDVKFHEDSLYIADKANKRIVRIKDGQYSSMKLSFEPDSIAFSNDGNLVALGEGKLVHLYEDGEDILSEGFSSGILAGFDRNGYLWGADIDRIFFYDGNNVNIIPMKNFMIITDIELSPSGIWVLNAAKDELILIDKDTFEEKERLPAYGSWCFETTLDGKPVVISEGYVCLVTKSGLSRLFKTPDGTMNVEYSYPFFAFLNWKDHCVDVHIAKGTEPLIVKVDRIEMKQDSVELTVRFEDVFGNILQFVHNFVSVREGGGPVFISLEPSYRRLSKISTTQEYFLAQQLSSIPRGRGYAVVFESIDDRAWKRSTLVTLREKGIRIFTKESPFSEVAFLSGGSTNINDNKEFLELTWKIMFKRKRPAPSDIVPVAVELKMPEGVYSDTIYYTKGLVTQSTTPSLR